MLKDILSISGHSGLFKLVAQSSRSIIVESLETHQRIPVYFTSKVSALEDIAIYTEDEELPLAQVFEKIYKMENKGQTSISAKSTNEDIKDYFEDILPDYDKSRVYVSDMKKVLSWYNILLAQNILNFEEEKKEKKEKKDEETQKAEVKPAKEAEEVQEEAPKKSAKKPAAKTAKTTKPKAGKKDE